MRSITAIATQLGDEQLKAKIAGIFAAYGFTLQKYKGMTVWKKGVGCLTAPQIFEIKKEGGGVVIGAWLPFALFPGVYIGESGLQSNFGFAVKVPMRNLLKELVKLIAAPGAMPQGYMPKK